MLAFLRRKVEADAPSIGFGMRFRKAEIRVYAAWGVALSVLAASPLQRFSWWGIGLAVLCLAPLFWVVYRPVILDEERILGELFKEEFEHYQRCVPRFLPRIVPVRLSADSTGFSWKNRVVNNREYEAVLGFFLALLCLYVFRNPPPMRAGTELEMELPPERRRVLRKTSWEQAAMLMRGVLIVAIVPFLSAGCTTYHKRPLTGPAVAEKLTPPDMTVLSVEAGRIKHPILKPVELDTKRGLTPDEAAVLAVLINPGLRAARDREGVASAQLYQVGILPNPQLSAGLDFPFAGATAGTVTAYGLSLGYDTYSLITRGARIAAARLRSGAVHLDVAWQEWQVAEAAKLHSYRLYLLQKQLDVAREEERGLQENRDAVKEAIDYGDMTLMDLSAAQASLERVHLMALAVEQNLVNERLALLNSIGFRPERSIRLREEIELPDILEIPQVQELMAGIEDRRLDLLALKIGYDSQEETVRAAVLGQFPKITLGGTQARDTGNVVSGGPFVTIDLPVFDRNQGNIAIERATRDQLFDEYVARLFDAESNIATLRANMEWIAHQIRATEIYLPTLERLVATYHDALLQGDADVLTYYNARDDLIATHIDLLNLQLQWIDHFIGLEIASGEYLWQAQDREVPR